MPIVQAIDMANDPEFGLSASVWSGDLARADRVARAIYTGNVSINNVMLTEGNHALPFGGVYRSDPAPSGIYFPAVILPQGRDGIPGVDLVCLFIQYQ